MKVFKSVEAIEEPVVKVSAPNFAIGDLAVIYTTAGRKIPAMAVEVGKEITRLLALDSLSFVDRRSLVANLGPINFPVGKNLSGAELDFLGRFYGLRLSKKFKGLEEPFINPKARKVPRRPVETGISSIDLFLTLAEGQKIPIFYTPGTDALGFMIHLLSNLVEQYYVVFAGIGITSSDYIRFKKEIEKTKAAINATFYIASASDYPTKRILALKAALQQATHLAFEEHERVIFLCHDIFSYAEALRETSLKLKEYPARQGYPAYLYSELARFFEVAAYTAKGSLTLISSVFLPGGDISHIVPDTIGYITEGQIFLDRRLATAFAPPVDLLKSLSRMARNALKSLGHKYLEVSQRLYRVYAEGAEAQEFLRLFPQEAGEIEKQKAELKEKIEKKLLNQEHLSRRSFEETLSIALELMGDLDEG